MSDLEKAIEDVKARLGESSREHTRNGVGVPIGQFDLRVLLDAARRFASLTSPASTDTEDRLWMCRLRLTDGSTRRTIREEKPTVCWYTGVSEHIHHCGWFVPVKEAVLRSVEEGTK